MAGRIDPIATLRPEAQTVFEGFLDELELELSRELSAIELDKMGTAPSSNNLGRATMGSLPVRMQMLR